MLILTQSGDIVNTDQIESIRYKQKPDGYHVGIWACAGTERYWLGTYASIFRAQQVIEELFNTRASRHRMPDK